MENEQLNAAAQAIPPEKRMQEAYALLEQAVYGFYFAKELIHNLGPIAARNYGPYASGLSTLRDSAGKGAVIAIAKTIDEQTGRTRSLHNSLAALRKSLEDSSADTSDTESTATIQLIEHIVRSTNPDRVKSLMYVRHIRNKWAGHSSWDLGADSWPTGERNLNFPLLEDGLVRLVNAFQEFGVLLEMSPYLQTLEDATQEAAPNSDGSETIRLTVSWKESVAIAHTMRAAGQESARQVLSRLQ